MGGELLVDLLPSGKLYVCYSHAYSNYSQRASRQVSRFFPGLHPGSCKNRDIHGSPHIFEVEGDHPREWVIRLDKNLYGLRDAVMARFEKLKEGLEARSFSQSQLEPCVWYKEEIVLLFYVDYCLKFSPSNDKIDEA